MSTRKLILEVNEEQNESIRTFVDFNNWNINISEEKLAKTENENAAKTGTGKIFNFHFCYKKI